MTLTESSDRTRNNDLLSIWQSDEGRWVIGLHFASPIGLCHIEPPIYHDWGLSFTGVAGKADTAFPISFPSHSFQCSPQPGVFVAAPGRESWFALLILEIEASIIFIQTKGSLAKMVWKPRLPRSVSLSMAQRALGIMFGIIVFAKGNYLYSFWHGVRHFQSMVNISMWKEWFLSLRNLHFHESRGPRQNWITKIKIFMKGFRRLEEDSSNSALGNEETSIPSDNIWTGSWRIKKCVCVKDGRESGKREEQ